MDAARLACNGLPVADNWRYASGRTPGVGRSQSALYPSFGKASRAWLLTSCAFRNWPPRVACARLCIFHSPSCTHLGSVFVSRLSVCYRLRPPVQVLYGGASLPSFLLYGGASAGIPPRAVLRLFAVTLWAGAKRRRGRAHAYNSAIHTQWWYAGACLGQLGRWV